MLLVTLQLGDKQREDTYTIGANIGVQNRLIMSAFYVINIQANNDELRAILHQFRDEEGRLTIPYTPRDFIVWYGDIAKFIAGNIKL